MSNVRINPQAIAAAEYKPTAEQKPAAKPVINVSRPAAHQKIRDNIANNPTAQAALDLLKQIVEDKAQEAKKPVRAVVATPAVTADSKRATRPETQSTEKETIMTLQAQLAVAREENTQLKDNIVSLSTEITSLKSQLAEISDDRDQVVAQLTAEDQRSADRIAELEELCASLHNDLHSFAEEKKEALEARIAELTKANEDLSDQLRRCEDYDSILSQFINAQESANTLDEENRFLEKKVQLATEEVDRLKAINNALETKLLQSNDSKKEVQVGLSAAVEDLSKKNSIIAERDAEIVSLKAQHAKLLNALKAYIEVTSSQ